MLYTDAMQLSCIKDNLHCEYIFNLLFSKTDVYHASCAFSFSRWLRIAVNVLISPTVTVHTAGRDEEHADEEVLQNNSL